MTGTGCLNQVALESVGKARRAVQNKAPARSQAERSASTRSRVLEATVTCLHRMGYSATTLQDIAEEAGVSRGALTHHFPSKIHIMLAAVAAIYEDDVAVYQAARVGKTPRQIAWEMPRIAWQRISSPSGMAVTEIMLASRSDRQLAAKLRDLQTGIDDGAHEDTARTLEAAGVASDQDSSAVHRMVVGALRGLAIEAVLMADEAQTRASLEALFDALGHLNRASGRRKQKAPTVVESDGE